MTDEFDRDIGSGATGTHERWTEETLRRLIGYRVVDSGGEKIGTVSSIWEDSRGEPAFLGIRTGWFGLGRTHVVPAHSAEWSEGGQVIRLPFAVAAVKEAPTFTDEEQLDPVAESRIYTHYQRYGFTMPGGEGAGGTSEGAGEAAEAAPTTGTDTMATGMSEEKDRVIPLREEELVVGKRQVEAGGVRLRKIVRTEVVNQPVEVRREDVVIERVPATGATTAEGEFRDEEIYVPLRREEAVVGKRAHVREEVRVRKQETVEQQPVNEQLRREDVEVERDERATTQRPAADRDEGDRTGGLGRRDDGLGV